MFNNNINNNNRYSKETLEECLKYSNNYKELILNLGLKPCTSAYRRVQEKLSIFGIDCKKLNSKPLILYDEIELKEAINSSNSYNEVLRKFNRTSKGGNLAILKKYITKYDISIKHFKKPLVQQKQFLLKKY